MISLIDGEKLEALLHLVATVSGVPGCGAECGVYQGGTLRALATACPDRMVIGFDTFSGLPWQSWRAGEPHAVGDFSDVTFDAVREYVAGLQNVLLMPGIFPASASRLADQRFAFVHIDFDYYRSTKAAIDWFLPRMSAGGVMVFDDYGWERCPGVKLAIEEAGLLVEATASFQVLHRVPA